MFCILQHIANTTYCRNRLLLLQSLLQSTHRIHVQKHKYFKEKADMLFLQSFWICSTTAYPEKKIIETLKMQWYPGTRFRRKKIYNSISCISLSTFQKITATSITSVQLFIPPSFFMFSPFLELFNVKWNSTDFQSVVF